MIQVRKYPYVMTAKEYMIKHSAQHYSNLGASGIQALHVGFIIGYLAFSLL